jgi:hypothetical protein
VRAAARSVRRAWLSARSTRAVRRFRPSNRELRRYPITDLGAPFFVAVLGQGEFFEPYRDELSAALGRVGASVTVHDSLDSVGEAHALVVVGPHQHHLRPWRRRFARTVLAAIQTEQLPTCHQRGFALSQERLADYLAWCVHYDLIIEWSREAAEFLRGIGPNILHLPHGHLDLATYYGVGSQVSAMEKHDVLFLGGLGGPEKRRRRLIEQVREDFDVHPATGRKVWGVEKVEAMRQSRLVLNLNSDLSMAFPSPRFFETLSLGRPLLSEVVSDPWPFVPGIDFLDAPQPGLLHAIGEALSDPELRARIGESGRATAREHTMDAVAKRLLGELVALHRAIAR